MDRRAAACCILALAVSLPAGAVAQPLSGGAAAGMPAAAPAVPAASAARETSRPPLVGPGESLAELVRITADTPSYWPVMSPDASYLVFVGRGTDGGTDLILKRSMKGTALTHLTSFPGNEKQPAVSPDGQHVAFAGDSAGNFDIYVISTRGGMARRQVTSSPGDEEFPDWSPSGRLIAYSARSPVDGVWTIWVKDLRSGLPTQYGEGLYPRFSPDGKLLLFQKPAPGAKGTFALWTMDLNGANLTQITAARDWGAIQPRWSPDGKRIVFCAARGEAAAHYTIHTDSGEMRTVALTGNTNIWTIKSDGSDALQLTMHPADDWYPFWTPSGDLFFNTTRDGATRVWRFTLPLELLPRKPAAAAGGGAAPVEE